jgi:two-component system sensor histidine kinase KdpD
VNDEGVTAESADTLSRGRVLSGYVVAVVGTAVLTAGLVPFRAESSLSFEALLFLAFVVLCALIGGRWPAVVSAVASALALNYWFTQPLHQLRIAEPRNVATVTLFLVVAVAVSSVVDLAARRAHQATVARDEADTLAMLNRAALADDDVARLLRLVASTYAFSSASVVDGRVVVTGREPSAAQRRVLDAFSAHLTLLASRAELARQAAAAQELEEGNRIRTALLAAISHDLRTPLAGIKVAVSSLRTPGLPWSDADRAELLAAIEESSDRLDGIVGNLLDMTRLRTDGVTLSLSDVAVEDLVARSLVGMVGDVSISMPDDLPAVHVDAGLMERVLVNLVANAVAHGGWRVQIEAGPVAGGVALRVVDHGPGVPPSFRERMFQPFTRDEPVGDGVGLGLSVARGLAQVQGASVEVEDTPGGGLTMVVTLPVEVAP